jgi:hypothetical protein
MSGKMGRAKRGKSGRLRTEKGKKVESRRMAKSDR